MEEPRTYLLKKGTVLYRGDTPFYLANKDMPLESLHLEVKPTFLALEPDDVYQYGIIYGWEVPEDIELPFLDNHDVMNEIYNGAPPDVQQVMKENYGYLSDGFGDRVSYFEKDILFYQYLCEKGYPGYASHDLEEGVRTSVEIMVCNPSGYKCSGMFFPNDVGDKELYIRNQIQKYYERVNPNGKQKKKKAMVAESPGIKSGWSPMKGSLSFGDSPSATPSATPIKGNLFGSTPSATPIKGNLFGDSPSTAPENGNLFGSTPSATPINGNLFGDDSHVFTPLKNSIRTADEFSSKLPVTDLYGAPLRGADSNLHWYKTPKKGRKSNGGKSKRNRKSKRNMKSKVTRRR